MKGRRIWRRFAVLAACASACGSPTRPAPTPPVVTPVLVGAGDIADCTTRGAADTAALLDGIPGAVFTAGDNTYAQGSLEEFRNCYGPTWGRHKARTYPTPGNHDYETPGAAGYFAYFGERAGSAGIAYYSFNVAEWHVVALDSNVPSTPGSAQYEWLRNDLRQNATACVAAVWHHPVFSSGRNGPQAQMRDAWRLLQESGADVVVNGHDHLYERFAPLDAAGRPDAPSGMREFIAGTGGAPLYEFHGVAAGSEARIAQWGVLKLTLTSNAYEWSFVSVTGGIADSGRTACH